jgi:phosphoribosyl 1,2-cyclic phosphate phosphodiesterase
VSDGTSTILIDTSTDLRSQALRHDVCQVDAVVYTHAHADHLHGIDDLRGFTVRRRAPIPVYADRLTVENIRHRYEYMFSDPDFKLGWGIPRLDLAEIPAEGVRVGAMHILPVPIMHGSLPILGYRIGPFAYLTDCSDVPESSRAMLHGLDTLVIDGLRPRPHPTHFSISQAVDMVRILSPRQAFLTHLTHDVDHDTMEAELPDDIHLAWDGLRVEMTAE